MAVLVLITQHKCTVTLCMQTSHLTSQPALSFTTTLDQAAIPTFSSSAQPRAAASPPPLAPRSEQEHPNCHCTSELLLKLLCQGVW